MLNRSRIELTGGNNSGVHPIKPDLLVHGGVEIKKDLVVSGNIFSNIIGDVTGKLKGDTLGNVTSLMVVSDIICTTDKLKTDCISPLVGNAITIDGNMNIHGDSLIDNLGINGDLTAYVIKPLIDNKVSILGDLCVSGDIITNESAYGIGYSNKETIVDIQYCNEPVQISMDNTWKTDNDKHFVVNPNGTFKPVGKYRKDIKMKYSLNISFKGTTDNTNIYRFTLNGAEEFHTLAITQDTKTYKTINLIMCCTNIYDKACIDIRVQNIYNTDNIVINSIEFVIFQ